MSAPASSPLLRVHELCCHYGAAQQLALDHVSFELARGKRLAIVGESGAGKSTLLRCLNLLVRPSHGTVELEGRSLTELDERPLALARRNLGMIFQHFALLSRRTVRDNVGLPLELAGEPAAHIAARVDELLARVRLSEKAGAYPAELSGGQRQRAGIARALAHAPRVLLCDEPTSALDAETARHVVTLLDELSRELQLTIVFVTHQLELVRALADDVAVLDRGVLRELTPVPEFFTRPRSTAGQRLLQPETRMLLPLPLIDEARRHAGVGPSTLLVFPISSPDGPHAVFRTLAQFPSLRADVLGANIETLRGTPVGALCLLVHGDPALIGEAIAAFEAQHISLELVGHVRAAA